MRHGLPEKYGRGNPIAVPYSFYSVQTNFSSNLLSSLCRAICNDDFFFLMNFYLIIYPVLHFCNENNITPGVLESIIEF